MRRVWRIAACSLCRLTTTTTTTTTTEETPAPALAALAVTYTPGSGPGGPLAAPTTVLTSHCDLLSECLSKADELNQQLLAQRNNSDPSAQILTEEGITEFIGELRSTAVSEALALVEAATGGTSSSIAVMSQAGMHELRRMLYYAVQLKERDWVEAAPFNAMMRSLSAEFLRRDNLGVMAPDDVLYVSTHVTVSGYYNRALWNRLEHAMTKPTHFENISMSSIKAFTTRLFKTRRGCGKETLDLRRKILVALARRVGVLANDLDLPTLLGVLQCYTVHDLTPRVLEPLVVRATNHVRDFTPHECATLSQILRKWRLMRLEACEKLVERICTTDVLSHHMALSSLLSLRSIYSRVSDGGRNAVNAEPMRQKLRALGEQIAARLDEATLPTIPVVLQILDVIVTMRIYTPTKCLTHMFGQANDMLAVVLRGSDELVDPKTGKKVRPVTAEEGRQLMALLGHFGAELGAELHARLREAFAEGSLPDEASLL